MPALPGILAEIADVAGEDAALAIARARGGTQIYIPPRPANDHWLCELIGIDAARKVCAQLTGEVASRREIVPLGPVGKEAQLRAMRAADKALMDEMIRQQKSEREISLATGYTVRTVRKRRAQLGSPRDDRQMSLI